MWEKLLLQAVAKLAPVFFAQIALMIERIGQELLTPRRRDEYAEHVEAVVRVVARDHGDMTDGERLARARKAIRKIEQQKGWQVSDSTRNVAIELAVKAQKGKE